MDAPHLSGHGTAAARRRLPLLLSLPPLLLSDILTGNSRDGPRLPSHLIYVPRAGRHAFRQKNVKLVRNICAARLIVTRILQKYMDEAITKSIQKQKKVMTTSWDAMTKENREIATTVDQESSKTTAKEAYGSVAHQWENNWFKLVDANNTMVEVIGDLAEMTRPSLAVPISHERLDKFISQSKWWFVHAPQLQRLQSVVSLSK
ncbi:hypothetical protein Purlil1_10951 [Purpureocillium lilacinum]|uniref:Uncharacterized protein n=1 Tax=Purpureocillium lilacinum TaxID=33203 RepID=A0ABR0BLN7_PURLI|nr:hypothetical protein Purlil1_10951 [Purpureocillium lilacinum]